MKIETIGKALINLTEKTLSIVVKTTFTEKAKKK